MGRRGLTVVELLVCLTVIGVIVALTFPAVSAARRAARLVSCRSAFHAYGTALGVYGASHHDLFPARVGPPAVVGPEDRAFVRYRSQRAFVLASAGFLDCVGFSRPVACPEARPTPQDRTGGGVALTSAAYFSPRSFSADSTAVEAVVMRQTGVAHPSRKVTVWENLVWHCGSASIQQDISALSYVTSTCRGSVVFADGHVDQLHAAGALPWIKRSLYFFCGPYDSTEMGLLGVDR